MGIKRDETLPNGVPLTYWRIVSMNVIVNNQVLLEVAGYITQDKRSEEQEGIDNPDEGCDVYIETRYFSLDYDSEMSVTKAYELLKQQEGWEDSEDVIDTWEAGLAYYTDDLATYEDKTYQCIQPHTSQEGWEPPNVPALWKEYQDPSVIPEWVQPTGAQDAYAKGDHVMHGGKEWVSVVDANTWEPGVYGWDEI